MFDKTLLSDGVNIGKFHLYVNNILSTTFDVPGSYWIFGAKGINDGGDIVGTHYAADGGHLFLYSGGSFTTRDIPGLQYAGGLGINNRLDIVGYYVDANNVRHGFLASRVPEPTTMLLLGIGLIGLARVRRKF